MRRLSPPDAQDLRALVAGATHDSPELRYFHRLHVVLMVALGQSCYLVAQWFGHSPRSVERWVHAYQLRGSAGLMDHPHGGRKAAIDKGLSQQLISDLGHAPADWHYPQQRWSGKLLERHLRHRYQISLSLRHCQRLMRTFQQR